MYVTASPTVAMLSASSSEISISNSSSSSITNSTTSNESSPRSPVNEASSFTSLSSTPRRSTITLVILSITVANVVTSPQIRIQKTFLHDHSAIKMKRLARHIGSIIRSQEKRSFRDIFRRTEPAQRNLSQHRFLDIFGQLVGHIGRDESGRYSIGCDAAACQFTGCCFSQSDDTRF